MAISKKPSLFILPFDDMKRFILHIILFSTILFAAAYVSLWIPSFIVENRAFQNADTEGNLLVFEKDEPFDLLFLGISHARNFSRHNNHNKVTGILNKKILNLGQGGGACSINEQRFYLDYFYAQNNTTNQVILVLSPPMLFSHTTPLASNTFDNEPFDSAFLYRYLFYSSENKKQRIWSYLNSKMSLFWLRLQPDSKDGMFDALTALDSTKVRKGQDLAYSGKPINNARFQKSKHGVEAIIKLARDHDSEVVLFIPPALFGKWRGHDETAALGALLAKQENVSFYDFSESVLEPKYYYDHHHLNTPGVVHFTEQFLQPVLN